MSGHLFLGGPVHGECVELHGTPKLLEFPVIPKMPVVNYTSKDELVLDDPLEVTRFAYEPILVMDQKLRRATVYVPAHLSKAAQWELVKALGLGEVPEG